jgi:hypothetical protein
MKVVPRERSWKRTRERVAVAEVERMEDMSTTRLRLGVTYRVLKPFVWENEENWSTYMVVPR